MLFYFSQLLRIRYREPKNGHCAFGFRGNIAIFIIQARFVSLSLRDGRVVFQIGYGGESQLEMSSTKKYNDGNWTVVEATRNFDKKRNVEKGEQTCGAFRPAER